MADINQVISLGIGTPSGIPEFLTFGLQIGAALDITVRPNRLFIVQPEDRDFTVVPEERILTVS